MRPVTVSFSIMFANVKIIFDKIKKATNLFAAFFINSFELSVDSGQLPIIFCCGYRNGS